MPRLVLASSSPWRRRILGDAGLDVSCVSPSIDEGAFVAPDPAERALAIARAKAAAVEIGPDAIGIAADQVVYDPVRGTIFGKPEDDGAHVARLLDLRGRTHHLVTGFVVWSAGWEESGVTVARVAVRADVTEEEIRAYVATGEASGCAGGYAAEAGGSFLIDHIVGDQFQVIGLPLYAVYGALRRHGWRFGA
ncbi:MAG: Maf family protein [Alphaproteobacteria bacterium]|nr:Maf family protein [Alphaproteobacteria bacterium]MCB9690410.1 Maf family protein [Alphaproteobacteria bacterium]